MSITYFRNRKDYLIPREAGKQVIKDNMALADKMACKAIADRHLIWNEQQRKYIKTCPSNCSCLPRLKPQP